MKKIRDILSAYKVMALCAAVVMMASLTFASISIAKSDTGEAAAVKKENCAWYKRHSYYSDATFTTQVGTKIWFCDGLVGRSGTATPYYQEYFCECFEEGK